MIKCLERPGIEASGRRDGVMGDGRGGQHGNLTLENRDEVSGGSGR